MVAAALNYPLWFVLSLRWRIVLWCRRRDSSLQWIVFWGVTVRGWSTHSCRFGFILPYYRVPVYLMMSCGFGPRLAGVGSTFGVWDRSKGGGSLCVNCVAPTHNRGPVPLVAVSEIVFPLGYEMPSMLSGCEAWHLIFRFCSLVADLFVRTTSH